jgi:glycosyltransferase involved in cell wall biosynthesis
MASPSSTSSVPSLAAVVLCLNEAGNLPRCLASLHWCDELLMLDSGSSDGSQARAAGLGARVLEHRQQGRFLISDQRNWALEHGGLQSDWVLFLDADEEVGASCRRAIQRAIASPGAADGFELTPRYWFLGRWLKRSQGYPNWHPRLLRRGRLEFEGGVWESFSGGGRLARIPEPYEHYAFSKGIDDWLERHRRYADWEAERICNYLASRDGRSLGTRRWLRLRQLTARLWPLRPVLRFSQKYLLQGGLLESWQGLLFALLMAGYDLITVVKVIERRRQDQGLPL